MNASLPLLVGCHSLGIFLDHSHIGLLRTEGEMKKSGFKTRGGLFKLQYLLHRRSSSKSAELVKTNLLR